MKTDAGGLLCILAVYVDDIIITARTTDYLTFVKHQLKNKYKIKELGPTSWILGIAVERNRAAKTVNLHQHKYIQDLLVRFELTDVVPISLPCSGGDDKPSTSTEPCDRSR